MARHGLPVTDFTRYIGIDYSGASTSQAPLSGLRVYVAAPGQAAVEEHPAGPRRHWNRRNLAIWLFERLREKGPTIVGMDHSFSFPLRYFDTHGLTHDWMGFLRDFVQHWPTHEAEVTVEQVRRGQHGAGPLRLGNARWRRVAELRSGGAKSSFHFDVPGSVAKSTHAGLPWLLHLRESLGEQVHFWPFDGWQPPRGRSVLLEAYPSLWQHHYARESRTADQHDAFCVASWLRDTDAAGRLAAHFTPVLLPAERAAGSVEGWILGVEGGAGAEVRR